MQHRTGDRSDGVDLGERLRAVAAWGDPGMVPDPAELRASTVDLAPGRARRSLRRWGPLAAAAAVAVVVGIAALTSPGNDEIDVAGGSDFASVIEASGVVTSPSADEVEQAMDPDLYKPGTGETQVSAAGNYVSLRTCRSTLWAMLHLEPSPACPDGFPAGWAYEAGTADGGEAHHGLLGEANHLWVSVLDDRYFVVVEHALDGQAPSAAWLIDAVSGAAGPLRWRDTPTTLRSPGQALLVCDEVSSGCFLPRVVDAREGTIQPLAVPDDAAPALPVAQRGTGRIWVGTAADGDRLGLAYSDDGGATWTEVALPEQLAATNGELPSTPGEDKLIEIAADGDRVAVAPSWERDTERDHLYVSEDAGRSWATPALPEPEGNGAHLYVLADRRLVLMWSIDGNPRQLLVSAGADWAALQPVDAPWDDPSPGRDSMVRWAWREFSVNQGGVALSSLVNHPCDDVGETCPADVEEVDLELDVMLDFSTDLTDWRPIQGLDD